MAAMMEGPPRESMLGIWVKIQGDITMIARALAVAVMAVALFQGLAHAASNSGTTDQTVNGTEPNQPLPQWTKQKLTDQRAAPNSGTR